MPKDDLRMIDLNVAVVEATIFVVIEENQVHINQSIQLVQVANVPETEEDIAAVDLSVDL